MVRRWSRMILGHPRVVVLLACLFAFFSLVASMQWLEIRPSRSELVFTGERLIQLRQAYKKEFGDRDGIVVVVDAADLPRAKQFVSTLAARLQRDREHVAEVFYRVDFAPFETHALQYLSLDEIKTLRRRIEDHQGLLRDLTAAPGLNTLFAGINREMGQALVGHFFTGFLEEEKRSGQVDLTLLNPLLRHVNSGLNSQDSFVSPWGEWLGEGKEPVSEGYLLTDDKRYLIVLATIRMSSGQTLVPDNESIVRIRAAIAEVGQAFPGIEAGVTGSDALGSDEIVTAKRDATMATIVALCGVTLLFLLFWRSVWAPARALISLAVGVSWTLGFITFTVGSLNILTAMFIPILIGLGIDYNIHLSERYEEERAGGRDGADAIECALQRGGTTVTGAITTVVAFYSLVLTDFKGLVELGFITGSGLLLCLGAAFTVLPSLLLLQEGRTDARVVPRSTAFLGSLERWSQYPRIMIAVAGLLVVASLPALGKIQFEFNLLELQAQGTESVVWERRLLADGGTSAWYGIALARSPEEVKTKKARLETLPSVNRVQSIFSFLPEEQSGKLAAIQTLRSPLSELPATFGRLEPVNLERLKTTFERMRFKLGDKERFTVASDEELEEARRLLESLRARIGSGDPGALSELLTAYQAEIFEDFEKKITLLRKNLEAKPLTVAILPQEIRDRFIGSGGTFLLKIFPRGNSWGREAVQEFVREVRSVDPDAIGNPITAWEHGRSMEKGYLLGGLYAAIAMVVVILWSFGSVRHLLLALIPLLVGGVWTLGLMELFRINFSLANLILLPLIAGYGIMNGLHIVKRYQQEGAKSSIIANSTGRAVFLSASTTMVGFGSLMMASHRGIFSLGFLLSVGVGSILVASLTILPALLWTLSNTRMTESVGEETPPAFLHSKGSWQVPQEERDEERTLQRRLRR